jgi:S-adenosylmethionine hydrolase
VSGAAAPAPFVALLTDFGPGSYYVGQMHAVLARLAPRARVLDLAHDCPAGRVEVGAYLLGRTWPHCPPGTVHVVVVDPGVGGERALLAVRAGGQVFLGPDNGVLGPALGQAEEVRRIANERLFPGSVSATFHGRDVLAPVAARLVAGTPFAEVGPIAVAAGPPPGARLVDGGVEGSVLFEDRFGNLVTNVPGSLFEGWPADGAQEVRVLIGAATLAGLRRTYADVGAGELLAYVGSGEHLEVAVRGGSAAAVLGVGAGARVRVEVAR